MTITEIAELAGVSVATVSRAINHQGKVSEEVSRRVLDIVEKYHYVPNATGRSLRTCRTGMLLILLPGLSNSFYSNIVRGIEQRASENGYNIIAAPTQNKRSIEDKYLNMLHTHQVDGVIALSTTLDREEIRETGMKLPLVIACECPSGAEISSVQVDNQAAAYDAAEALIRMGHRRIGMISSVCTCNSRLLRENGYTMALDAHGISHAEELMVRAEDLGYDSGFQACRQLMEMQDRPTALFCYCDQLAIGALRYLDQMGLAAGHDVDVIGFDDIDIAGSYLPALSSVAQPCFDMGTTSFDLLLEKINQISSTPKKVILPHRLVLRDTTHTLTV
ncbi:MAG: LacI family transcriptional regulator [Butyrivibrio sp.]|jgi:DNA-binding LacI/PurR family transcriptional regulator|nr:LacI family transcriptional regulator [Butyrivibrio sp.]